MPILHWANGLPTYSPAPPPRLLLSKWHLFIKWHFKNTNLSQLLYHPRFQPNQVCYFTKKRSRCDLRLPSTVLCLLSRMPIKPRSAPFFSFLAYPCPNKFTTSGWIQPMIIVMGLLSTPAMHSPLSIWPSGRIFYLSQDPKQMLPPL